MSESMFVANSSVLSEDGAINGAIKLINELIIKQRIIYPRISAVSDIQPYLYNMLFEKVFGYKITDIIQNPSDQEDEIHNVQSIIDTLSLDILHLSLSHITGEDIVSRQPFSVLNLLELFNGCINTMSMSESSDIEPDMPKSVKDTNSKISDDSYPKFSTISSSITSLGIGENTTSKTKTNTSVSSLLLQDSVSKASSSVNLHHLKPPKDATPSFRSLKTISQKKTPKRIFKRVLSTPVKKSVLIPKYLKRTPQSVNKNVSKTSVGQKTCHLNSQLKCKSTSGILEDIQNHLPGITLSTQTTNLLRKDISRHVRIVTSRIYEMEHKKTKAKILYEAAVLRQQKILEIAAKDRKEKYTFKTEREIINNRLKIQGAFRDCNISKCRIKRYNDDFVEAHRSKMAQKSTKEEMLVQTLYRKRLSLQKQQLHDVCKDYRQFRNVEANREQNYIDSLNNLYENEFEMLKDKTNEIQSLLKSQINDQNQTQAKTIRYLREKLIAEVKEIQEEIEKRDDFFFRETDAEQLVKKWCQP